MLEIKFPYILPKKTTYPHFGMVFFNQEVYNPFGLVFLTNPQLENIHEYNKIQPLIFLTNLLNCKTPPIKSTTQSIKKINDTKTQLFKKYHFYSTKLNNF